MLPSLKICLLFLMQQFANAVLFDQNQLGLLLIPLPELAAEAETIPPYCIASVNMLRNCQEVISSPVKLQGYAKYGDNRRRALCTANFRSESCVVEAIEGKTFKQRCLPYITWEKSVSQLYTTLCRENATVTEQYKVCLNMNEVLPDTLCYASFSSSLAEVDADLNTNFHVQKRCRLTNKYLGCKWSAFDFSGCDQALELQQKLDSKSLAPFELTSNCTIDYDQPLCAPTKIEACQRHVTDIDLLEEYTNIRTLEDNRRFSARLDTLASCFASNDILGCDERLEIIIGARREICKSINDEYFSCKSEKLLDSVIGWRCLKENTCRGMTAYYDCVLQVTADVCDCFSAINGRSRILALELRLVAYDFHCNPLEEGFPVRACNQRGSIVNSAADTTASILLQQQNSSPNLNLNLRISLVFAALSLLVLS